MYVNSLIYTVQVSEYRLGNDQLHIYFICMEEGRFACGGVIGITSSCEVHTNFLSRPIS